MWAEKQKICFCKKGYCFCFLYGTESNAALGISMCFTRDIPGNEDEFYRMLHPDMEQTSYVSRQYTYST